MQIGEIIKTRLASIESDVSKPTSNTSIELPEEISSLIVGEAFREARINRYKMLIRQGHLQHLMELAAYCRRVGKNPAFMFAKYASKKKWDSTIKFCEALMEAARTAAEVAKRLSVAPCRAIYKACWRFKGAAIQKAALAEEIVNENGGNKLKLFNWFCLKT